mgnify:CR=1 FL=1
MRIKSAFKDYYDYQATIYGIDDSIIYTRSRIVETQVVDTPYGRQIIEPNLIINVRDWLWRMPDTDTRYRDDPTYSFDLLVIGDEILLLTHKYDVNISANRYTLVDGNHPVYQKYSHIRNFILNVRDDMVLAEKTSEICRQVGHPAFIVSDISRSRNRMDTEVTVQGRCPILKDIDGLVAYYPSGQIFQDLSYFLINKMKTSPDESPICPMTDKEKIVQHGMDLKQSFRHRK